MSDRFYNDAQISVWYADCRPGYPDALFETIANTCREAGLGLELAVDLGCGTGQSTAPLSPHFARVLGVDRNQSQISTARQLYAQHNNVQFRVRK